jgi:hypothetical protein
MAEGCRFLFLCTHVTAAQLEHTLHWRGALVRDREWGWMPRGTQHGQQAERHATSKVQAACTVST